jgi:N-acetylneuraminic acid mutarotase
MPTSRSGLAIGVINNKIYCIGGYSGSSYLRTNEVYDPLANTWTTTTNMPTARCYLAIGVVNGKIYAIGGATTGASYVSTNEELAP